MFSFFKKGLNKTTEAMKVVVPKKRSYIMKETLEDVLLEADVEYELIEIILRELYEEKVTKAQLESKLLATMAWSNYERPECTAPFVDLIVGVNGAGKTTTIAKLAQKSKDDGQKVMLGAADTFRAAAIEQLTRWAEKIDVPIISSRQGHDPSAVCYDTIESAKAKGFDHVILDTAGRLHTQTNLSNELKKIVRISDKAHAGAPHRKILILDGTQGNSAIAQAKAFNEMIDIDGIIITKLDGTAKGGSIFSIAHALRIPILYVGVGEQPKDLVVFDKYAFIDNFLDPLFEIDEESDKLNSVSGSLIEITQLTAEQRQKLNDLLNTDGYDVLSKHFVRDQKTWDEYKILANEDSYAIEITAKDGSVIKSYKADQLL